MKPTKTQLQKRLPLLFFVLLLALLLGVSFLFQRPTTDKIDPPAYVFLFIGDGMGTTQVNLADQYQQALDGTTLTMTTFPTTGLLTTADLTAAIPDSASAGTAIATGERTYTDVIGIAADGVTPLPTIAEELKEIGYDIGVVSTMNVNHATPAAFYAHVPSREQYYDIGLALIDTGFDYVAGGALLHPTGADGTFPDLYTLATQAGIAIAATEEERLALPQGQMALVTVPADTADGSMTYAMERPTDTPSLATLVADGIDHLGTDSPFFILVEGGKIDKAGHANDAAAIATDTIALDEAVAVAYDFYEKHPDDTLILVTADHETGGLSMGQTTTVHSINFDPLLARTVTKTTLIEQILPTYQQEGRTFLEVADSLLFMTGLSSPTTGTSLLTEEELTALEASYKAFLSSGDVVSATAFADLLFALSDQQVGVAFSSNVHTAAPVPLFAVGVGAEAFSGYGHLTTLHDRLTALLRLDDPTV